MARITVKDRILSILNAHKGTIYSGQALADELGVSRTAVWKAVEKLREEGFAIEGTTNGGYLLSEETDILDAGEIFRLLSDDAKNFYRIRCEKEVTSTNDLVKEAGKNGEEEGFCILTEMQTAGKGRRGRKFFSPKSGLYFSILLRPSLPFEEAVQITTLAAVAGAKACEEVCPECRIDIKWVNDLFKDGKKFCGILTEADLSMESGGLDQAVLGIGFNVSHPEDGWPEELKDIATSIFGEKAPVGSRNLLAAAFLNAFLPIYQALPQVTYLEDYRKRLLGVGQKVKVLSGKEEPRNAVLVDVNDRCELLVRFEGENCNRVLNSGEISVKLS